MPSQKHIKVKERNNLADRIEKYGFTMPPCSSCIRSHRPCIVSTESTRCSFCVRLNLKGCDVKGPTADGWAKLKSEEARLEAEEEKAALQEHEAFTRRMRLRKQQKSLRERGSDMLQRGLNTLDELNIYEVEQIELKEGVTQDQKNETVTALDLLSMLPSQWDTWMSDVGPEFVASRN
jgi:hypothetical protein